MTETWFDFDAFEAGGFALVTFEAQDRIFTSGQAGDRLYVVKSGQVDIIRFGTVLENVRANGMFGEMALIDGSPRSANAVAAARTTLAPIDEAAFSYLVARDPTFALRIMRMLADRLRRMNENL